MKKLEYLSNVSEVTLKYKNGSSYESRVKISGSATFADVCRELYDEDEIGYRESFFVVALNRANQIVGYMKVSEGGTCGTVADPKMIFAFLININAAGCILTHNHPTGNLNPSQADIVLTKKLAKGCEVFEIQLLDHVIISPENGKYYSLADNCDFKY